MREYKTCDKCCYDILDSDGDVMEHECIERVDNATNEIMDKIRDIFDEIDLIHYINNNTDHDIDDLDDRFYTIIHNQLKKMI